MSQKRSFFPTERKREVFLEVFLFLDEEDHPPFSRVFKRESFVSLFSRLAPSSLGSPPRKKKTWNASDDSTQKARRHHPRRDPREKTNAQTKKRPHGNASGCLKKEKSTEPWRSPRRARSARERRRRCRERNKIVQCRKGIIDIV